MFLVGSLPNSLLIASCTAGIRVDPPTNNTLSISEADKPASFIALRVGSIVASTRSRVNSTNLARVNVTSKCLGPVASAVMNGKLICVLATPDNSILAFSAASFKRWSANLSLDKSIPVSFLNSLIK